MSDSVRQRVVAIMNALMPAGDFVPARSLSFGRVRRDEVAGPLMTRHATALHKHIYRPLAYIFHPANAASYSVASQAAS